MDLGGLVFLLEFRIFPCLPPANRFKSLVPLRSGGFRINLFDGESVSPSLFPSRGRHKSLGWTRQDTHFCFSFFCLGYSLSLCPCLSKSHDCRSVFFVLFSSTFSSLSGICLVLGFYDSSVSTSQPSLLSFFFFFFNFYYLFCSFLFSSLSIFSGFPGPL